MPTVPQAPQGPLYRIPMIDEPDAPAPRKIIVCGPKPISKKTIEGVVKMADAVAREYEHEPARKKPKPIRKQPVITITLHNCSWCGRKCAGDIHPECEEIRDRVRATKTGGSR